MGCQRLCSFSWRANPCRRRSRRQVRPPPNICHWDCDICGVPCLRSCDVCRVVDHRSQRPRHWSSATCAPKPCYYRSGLSEGSSRTRYRHWAGASAITTSLGPPLGGFLIDAFHWRAIFLINLPLAAAVIVLTLRYVPESRNDMISVALDWLGGLLAIVAFGSLTAGLTFISDTSGAHALVIPALCFGAIASVLFVFREARAASPVMPLSLFGNRSFLSANIMTLFLYGALTGILFLLPFDLIERRGMSATQVGLTLLPIGIIIGTFSRFAGVWADRDGPRGLLVVGSLLVAASAAGLAFGAADYWIGVVAPIVISSVGMALVVAPLTTAVMVSVPDNQSGAASGANNAARRLADCLQSPSSARSQVSYI